MNRIKKITAVAAAALILPFVLGSARADNTKHTTIGSQTGGAGAGKIRQKSNVPPQPLNPQPLPPGYRQPDTAKRGIIIDDSRQPNARKGSNE